ncbi:MAG: hypothetical protein ABJR46_19290 [Tateyamaria sp.]|uniref:hypothetical protein n=1 Tax=Tateyamaria sp. TaxID=1929288 RepID=UPI00329F4A5B
MKGLTLIAALAGWPFAPLHAQAVCETITDGVEYCTEAKRRHGGISSVIYADHVATYRLQRDPLVSSNIVVMPIDRTLRSANDLLDMVFDQFNRGTPPFVAVDDIETRNSSIDGRETFQVDFVGIDRNGAPLGAYIVDALPGADTVLMVFTVQETLAKESGGRPSVKVTAVTQDHRAAHAAALQDYRIGR